MVVEMDPESFIVLPLYLFLVSLLKEESEDVSGMKYAT